MYKPNGGAIEIAVLGIGRVGLPLALYLADHKMNVWGIGRNPEKIDRIAQGHMPFMETGASALLKKHINTLFHPTVSYDPVRSCSVVIITIGTPVDDNMNPVIDELENVMLRLLPFLRTGTVIILRSTVSPGTTEHMKYVIEKYSRFRVGKTIFLAFCPERIAQGKSLIELRSIPQIVGGIDLHSTQRAVSFFQSCAVETLPTDARSAELAKLFTNMYRYITFAIANEFMVLAHAHKRNMHHIADLVNHRYARGGLALPGFTGGPCLFKDGFFLVQDNPYADLITTSWKINESIPLVLIKIIKEITDVQGKHILVLGTAFKPDIDDTRESLSYKLIHALHREHAHIVAHDPYVIDEKTPVVRQSPIPLIEKADIIIIAVKHSIYVKKRNEIRKKIRAHTYVCDIWNMFGMNRMIFTGKELRNT